MLKMLLIICPMTFIAGLVDAVAGGGGLISLPAYLFAGLPAHLAIGTNKLSAMMGTTMAVFRLGRWGKIPVRRIGGFILCGAAGSFLGARLSLRMDDTFLKALMLIVLPAAAWGVLRGPMGEKGKRSEPSLRTGLAIAFALGIYDGFYGPGTGTFLILLLTGLGGYPLEEANGIAKSINLTTNVTSLCVFLAGGTVILPLGLAAGLCSLAGSYLGITFFKKKGLGIVRPFMIFVLGLFFVRLLTELVL